MKLSPLVLASACLFSANLFAQTTLIKNVNGYTMEAGELVQFHAVKYKDDIIKTVYKQGDVLPAKGDMTVIDGQQKTMLPGLIDAHGHVLNYGLSLLRADLMSSKSEQDAVAIISKYANENKALSWLQGRGWNQVQWPNKQFPTAASLDKVIDDKPVVLGRVDGHAIWVNSQAMELAGIDKDTKEIEGGEIVRDSDGNPTGVFIDNAMSLIYSKIPTLNDEEVQHALKIAMRSLASVGLTSVHDAGIYSDNLDAFKALTDDNEMVIRINAMLDVTDPQWRQQIAKGHYRSDDDMLVVHSVKISADGALGSRGAALIEDYSDKPHHKGLLLHDPADLTKLIKASMEAGFQVNTHAIGDNANKLVLDNYETLIKQTKTSALRHRVEHAQVLQLDDIKRFADNNIIASMQATHATSDKNMAEDRVGSERIKGAYAWRTLIDNGVVIAAGSDFPVEYPNPFFGLHASVTRQDQQNQPENGWYINEGMTLTEAFNSFTIGAAYAGHQETLLGSIEAGKKADFILIDQDIFKVAPEKIWQTKVIDTYVNGQKVSF
ncbi:amidohydrolase [Thalassotalea sp. HSM 43]|uniref:amidohydrolase n=1 Tax=Thalassotalea sp. HSM 43 TaxID=2552945 RepID=UPI001080D790|nr:amidohydrolase [Thalassotalea sp. HSM 43]QBY05381.1 amidohydrolase [Thalassotalea sp. HSM 43]